MRLLPWMQSPKPVPLNQEDYGKYNAYSQLLDRNGQWIGIADTKAGVILAFLVAAFPVLAAPALSVMQKLVKALPHATTLWTHLLPICILTLLLLFLIAAILTLREVLMTLIPRLTRQAKPGLIFFGDIACKEQSQWQQHLLAIDPHMLALQVLEQVYATAYIADIKHKHVRKAIRTLFIMLSIGLALYIISQFMG